MKNLIDQFIFALTFLTRIPVCYQVEYEEKLPGKSMIFYPLVGMIIGVLVVLVDLFTTGIISLRIRSIIVLLFYIYLTGGLHLDGFMDTIDGIFSGRKAEKMREIMHDSRIGAFGVIALFILLLLKYNLIFELNDSWRWSVLILMPALSRFILVGVVNYFPLAKSSKLGKSYKSYLGKRELWGASFLIFIVYIMLVFILNFPLLGLLVITVLSIVISLLIAYYIYSKIGGLTGDSYGTVVESSEVITLLTWIILN